jgi:hypothetical protein
MTRTLDRFEQGALFEEARLPSARVHITWQRNVAGTDSVAANVFRPEVPRNLASEMH